MAQALAQKTLYTREEYLEAEEHSAFKSEYCNGEVLAMAGGSRNHSVICVNLNWRLSESLSDTDCIVFDSNMKLDIAESRLFLYPDCMVVCGDIQFFENRTDTIRNPLLLIEVLSPATQAFDRGDKFMHYRTVSSLREDVMISQDRPMVEVYSKQEEGLWLYSAIRGIEERVAFQSIHKELALKDIYRKVDWKQNRKSPRELK